MNSTGRQLRSKGIRAHWGRRGGGLEAELKRKEQSLMLRWDRASITGEAGGKQRDDLARTKLSKEGGRI